MSYTSQDQLEVIVLKALYDFVQSESGHLTAAHISNLLNGEFSADRVAMALRALDVSGLLNTKHDMRTGSSYSIGDKGYRQVEEVVVQQTADRLDIPASDRIVSINHNSPQFEEISASLAELRDVVRTVNDTDIDEEERTRIMSGLSAASDLWDSTQLKIIQVKVGLLLAVEDAGIILARTSKAVAVGLLIDAIKAFFKFHAGVDFDKI